jgi:hypothetical protein
MYGIRIVGCSGRDECIERGSGPRITKIASNGT